MTARLQLIIDEGNHFSANDVINNQFYTIRLRNLETDRRARVKRVREILMQLVLIQYLCFRSDYTADNLSVKT